MFNNYYKNKKVLVTGHTGFKGSWLSLWLHLLGAQVIGFALPPNTNPNNFNVSKLENKITNIFGDIRKPDEISAVINEHQPEVVFHLAAQPIVRLSYDQPHVTYDTNVMGLVNLFESIRSSKFVKSIVNVTSDKCYENKEWVWGYRESDPLGGKDPYSSSKACSEIVTSSYRHSYFKNNKISLASARAGNIIGGGDWSLDRIIPDFIRAMANNETLIIRNPNAIRPWQHVLEPLSGYLWLGALLHNNLDNFSSAWNFGPDSALHIPVKDLVNKIIKYWGSGEWKIDPKASEQPHEAQMLTLDCSKAHQQLKWAPIFDTETTIKKTVEWYLYYYQNNQNTDSLCLKQIEEYSDLAKINKLKWAQ